MQSRFLSWIRHAPGLLWKIAGALVAVGTLPLLLGATQLAAIHREALYEQLLRTQTVAARTAADRVDDYLRLRRALADSLAVNPGLGVAGQAEAVAREALAASAGAGVVGISVHDRDGRLVLRAQTRESAADAEQLLAAAPDPSPTLVARGNRLWAVVPAILPAGAGTLAVAAEADAIERALDPDELGEEARIALLDRSGRALPRAAGAKLDAMPDELVSAALSGRLSGAGRFAEETGAELVGAWSAADQGRWIVVSTQPAAAAEGAARRMARRSALAVVFALALVALITVAAWRALVQPLHALLAAQRQVAGLSRSLAASSGIGELRVALADMERHAQDRQALDEVFLGRYQVLEIVGSGGMGTIFRGWDPRLQRAVALKTVHVRRTADTDARAKDSTRILAEAMRAAQISHPNVVAVYDAEETSEVAYVAMEYVDGVGLDRYLEERGQLDWREAVPLGRDIAEGLAAAHARQLVHRDVKPGNVLLGHDGSIKVADFGLATYLRLRSESPGKVFGTPGFLAPEVLRGEEYDARADLYAVGVLLFRVLAGRYPFRGVGFREIVRSTVKDPTPRPAELLHLMPPDVAEIVSSLLDKDPERRPLSAAEVGWRFDRLAREHGLVWRLDFTRATGGLEAHRVFASVSLPTMAYDGDS